MLYLLDNMICRRLKVRQIEGLIMWGRETVKAEERSGMLPIVSTCRRAIAPGAKGSGGIRWIPFAKVTPL